MGLRMPEITYQHQCGDNCSNNNRIIITHPRVDGSVYYEIVPKCIETHIELVRISDNSAF